MEKSYKMQQIGLDSEKGKINRFFSKISRHSFYNENSIVKKTAQKFTKTYIVQWSNRWEREFCVSFAREIQISNCFVEVIIASKLHFSSRQDLIFSPRSSSYL